MSRKSRHTPTANYRVKPMKMTDRSNREDEVKQSSTESLTQHALFVPPDGGWGWAVVGASFMSNFLVDGAVYNVGQIFQPIWTKYFNTSQGTCAWVISLLVACYDLAGPIISAVINVFGCRIAAFAGVAIACAGFIFSIFAPSIYVMYFTFGFLGGLGFGFLNLSSVVIVSYYFEKRRALATGIAVCGSGLGTMAFGPLLSYLNDVFLWQGTVLILAGIILNCAVCAAFYRPLKATEFKHEGFQQALVDHVRKTSTGSHSTDISIGRKQGDDGSDYLQSQLPRIIVGRSNGVSEPERTLAMCNGYLSLPGIERFRKRCYSDKAPHDSKVSSLPMLFRTCSAPEVPLVGHIKIQRKIYKQSIATINCIPNRKDTIFMTDSTVSLTTVEGSKKPPTETRKMSSTVHEPMTTEPKNLASTLKRAIKDLLDTSLLLSPTYIVFVIQGGLVCFAMMIPFVYLPPQALSLGYPEDQTTLLITYIGAVNIVSRVLCGYISDKPNIDPLTVQNATMLMAGIATVIVPFLIPYWSFVIYCAIFGLAIAAFYALRTVVCINLLGIERLTNAYGISLIFYGLVGIFGPPTAGVLYDVTGDYNLSFFTAGATLLLAALLGFFLNPMNRWEQTRSKDKQNKICSMVEVHSIKF